MAGAQDQGTGDQQKNPPEPATENRLRPAACLTIVSHCSPLHFELLRFCRTFQCGDASAALREKPKTSIMISTGFGSVFGC
jgi:hypothetical protein